jgi:SprA-related family
MRIPAASVVRPAWNDAPVPSVQPVRPRASEPASVLQLSARAKAEGQRSKPNAEFTLPGSAEEPGALDASGERARAAGSQEQDELSSEDQKVVEELERRDQEVRTHEQAHKTAGGRYAGAIHLDYQVGPDGARYAVGGHVPIDVAPMKGDPEGTLRKMDIVIRAALAPADPSGADRQIAAQAAGQAAQARADLAKERLEKTTQEEPSEAAADTEAPPPKVKPEPTASSAVPEAATGARSEANARRSLESTS